MKFEKKFCWKVLTEDGLLKDHPKIGPYYNQTTFSDEFDTEQEAVHALTEWHKLREYGMESEMVLVTRYHKVYEWQLYINPNRCYRRQKWWVKRCLKQIHTKALFDTETLSKQLKIIEHIGGWLKPHYD